MKTYTGNPVLYRWVPLRDNRLGQRIHLCKQLFSIILPASRCSVYVGFVTLSARMHIREVWVYIL